MNKKSKKFLIALLSVVSISLSLPASVMAADTTAPQVTLSPNSGLSVTESRLVTNNKNLNIDISAYDDSTTACTISATLKNSEGITQPISIAGSAYYRGTTYSYVNMDFITTKVVEDYVLSLRVRDSSYNYTDKTINIRYTTNEIAYESDMKKSYTPPYWGGPFTATATLYDLTGVGLKKCDMSIVKYQIPYTVGGKNLTMRQIRPNIYECSATFSCDTWGNMYGAYAIVARPYNNSNKNVKFADEKVTINPPVVYSDDYFNGAKYLDVGNYRLADLAKIGIKNDDISSIRIPAGYSLTVYSEDNFMGQSATFVRDCGILSSIPMTSTSNWNNKISSIKVTEVPAIYSQTGYQGQQTGLNEGSYTKADLIKMGINDNDISSMRIPYTHKVIVYSEDNFQGESKTFESTYVQVYPDLQSQGWNDKISSIKVIQWWYPKS